MQNKERLKIINDKYNECINKQYGQFVKHFRFRRDMTRGVKLLTEEQCVGKHFDLSKEKGNRGKCLCKNGNIYIREDALTDQVLVHEYIHRLSCNYRFILGYGYIPIQGIDYPNKELNGLSELLTDWIAYKITNIKEHTVYSENYRLIDEVEKQLGEEKFRELLKAFFHNKDRKVIRLIKEIENFNTLKDVNNLEELIKSRLQETRNSHITNK